MKAKRLQRKERDAIIHSLKAGVTPGRGIRHIQVGRTKEVEALCQDIERIALGGSAFRLIIGEYGSGKTFFLSVIKAVALEKKLVTVNADLSPGRRLQASGGQARNLYSELMRNLSTRNKPEGNALPSVVERFITMARQEADKEGSPLSSVIHHRLSSLIELTNSHDFAQVIEAYGRGHETDNEDLQSHAIRWLRGEYPTKTEARKDLDVSSIISDTSFYENLKIMSLFVRKAGYQGLLVNLDEMVNLYKLNNTQARLSNYEKILYILNDCLQGGAAYLGFLLGGTPEFLFDPRKGLYSYQALQTRLAENRFAQQAGVIDYSSPALHLANLTQEELHVLLENLRLVFASGDETQYLVPDEALKAFLRHCHEKVGEAYFRTPRNTIKAFVDMLSVIEQHKDISWKDLIESIPITEEKPSDMPELPASPPEGLGEFTL